MYIFNLPLSNIFLLFLFTLPFALHRTYMYHCYLLFYVFINTISVRKMFCLKKYLFYYLRRLIVSSFDKEPSRGASG